MKRGKYKRKHKAPKHSEKRRAQWRAYRAKRLAALKAVTP
jgi:hypothetical protein